MWVNESCVHTSFCPQLIIIPVKEKQTKTKVAMEPYNSSLIFKADLLSLITPTMANTEPEIRIPNKLSSINPSWGDGSQHTSSPALIRVIGLCWNFYIYEWKYNNSSFLVGFLLGFCVILKFSVISACVTIHDTHVGPNQFTSRHLKDSKYRPIVQIRFYFPIRCNCNGLIKALKKKKSEVCGD